MNKRIVLTVLILVLMSIACVGSAETVTNTIYCTINTDVSLLMPGYTEPGWALTGDELKRGETCKYLNTIETPGLTLYKVECHKIGYVLASECDK